MCCCHCGFHGRPQAYSPPRKRLGDTVKMSDVDKVSYDRFQHDLMTAKRRCDNSAVAHVHTMRMYTPWRCNSRPLCCNARPRLTRRRRRFRVMGDPYLVNNDPHSRTYRGPVRAPTPGTILRHDGPYHLGLW